MKKCPVIQVCETPVAQVSIDKTEYGKNVMKQLKAGVKRGSIIIVPVFADPGADYRDIVWESSNQYLATPGDINPYFMVLKENTEPLAANPGAYAFMRIMVNDTYTGKVTFTGTTGNSGKKIQFSFNVV